MKEETQNWADMAEMDLAAAAALLQRALYPLVVFHCQQAVEKLLKAIWVETTDETPPRTHNLVDLASELGLLLEEEAFLSLLTDQAVASRYAAKHEYSLTDAQDYYKRTRELCGQLRRRLS